MNDRSDRVRRQRVAKTASAPSTEDLGAMMLSVARRYYFHDQSKIEIGRELGISRFQVARLLEKARREGLVRIEIGSPGSIDPDLSAALADHLSIPRAVVVQTHPRTAESTDDLVGKATAAELERLATTDAVLGVAWSRVSSSMARNLNKLPRCSVVQLTGVIYPPSGMPGPVETARTVADAAGGDAHLLYAPLVMPDADSAQGVRQQSEIATTLAHISEVDVAVVAAGAWAPDLSALYGLLTSDEQVELAGLGACGEVAGRLMDKNGREISTSLDERVIGATLEQMRNVPRVIVSSNDPRRREATRAVVRAGLVHTLVVDDQLARAMLPGGDATS